MKIAFLLYPPEKIKPEEDTSFWIMYELSRRGHEVYHFESKELFFENGRLLARLSRSQFHPQNGLAATERSKAPDDLQKMDCLFIRKEPPFDLQYLYALQLLSLLKPRITMINDPEGIILMNEKLISLHFRELCPRTLVTDHPGTAISFIKKNSPAVVLKPLNDKAGNGIERIPSSKPSLQKTLQSKLGPGTNKMMLQRFVRAGRTNDKRILLLDGQILGVFARRPAKGEFRSNLSLGGSMHPAQPTRRDQFIIRRVSPLLKRYGLFLAGLDVLGGYLTEINVTSPSGVPELKSLYGGQPESKIVDWIEKRVRARRARF